MFTAGTRCSCRTTTIRVWFRRSAMTRRRYRVASAKALATMLLTLKGTPFIYQGDELGMTNYPFTSIDQFDDIAVKNAWKTYVVSKQVSADYFLAEMRKTSRDNSRTPMQWDSSANAGFTTAAKPWLAVNPNYLDINAKQELSDKGSIYHYFGQMAEVAAKSPAFVYGDYKDLDPANPQVFAYTRSIGDGPVSRGAQLLNRCDYLQVSRRELQAKQLVISNLGETNERGGT